ncbi:uncharacterized protein LOC110709275 [Chenopodium quinoa]|uniref:uncharacterized protein LOC110709275 n=1 Tax=Chenopodium quinoa TaxID=63459 RepID=UPI000B77FEFB|nr:uncharacterized protein LOC110709275 [Chenopodium quinoa]XP_021743184.1 uncharacterized protein LOC110709275 [Chenopodium quinoa]XP_021743185.1 uncharacterized protein LOC110709275 [Chenopodium quinoa]XP_021743186.1 uncharacterized protein LOC110709275 [Chenopodium quinoa]
MLVLVVQLQGFHCCLNVVEIEDLWFKVEQIKRWFSDDALQVVRKICSFLFRSISEDKVCMIGKQLCNNFSFSAIVVSFVGVVHTDVSCVHVVDAFFNNNRCYLLVLVSSELCDVDMKSCSALVTRVSFIFKCASSSNQLNVVVSNSLSDLFTMYNKRVVNLDALLTEIDGLTQTSSRNVLIVCNCDKM